MMIAGTGSGYLLAFFRFLNRLLVVSLLFFFHQLLSFAALGCYALPDTLACSSFLLKYRAWN